MKLKEFNALISKLDEIYESDTVVHFIYEDNEIYLEKCITIYPCIEDDDEPVIYHYFMFDEDLVYEEEYTLSDLIFLNQKINSRVSIGDDINICFASYEIRFCVDCLNIDSTSDKNKLVLNLST